MPWYGVYDQSRRKHHKNDINQTKPCKVLGNRECVRARDTGKFITLARHCVFYLMHLENIQTTVYIQNKLRVTNLESTVTYCPAN